MSRDISFIRKRLRILFLTGILFWSFPLEAPAQLNNEEPLSPRTANYDIFVEYKQKNHTLDGDMKLEWINPTRDTIDNLRFHTYMNAFKNSQSTFMQESGYSGQILKNKDNGWIKVNEISTKGSDLTYSTEFVQPDDNNIHDQTVMDVSLKNPVKPNDTITLNIDFKTKLPNIIARVGYEKDFIMAGQWYPKIGVYESDNTARINGSWNCHQFHANTEFYADFGKYYVEITVPKNYKVGATGELVDRSRTEGGKNHYAFRAHDVIDFAWTASKSYKKIQDSWNDVSLELLLYPAHRFQNDRILDAAKGALEYLDERVGDYPYNTLTIVTPPFFASRAAGMEYPALITTGTAAGMPKDIRVPELLTIHELVHQYFMGVLASNETEEPWLDEGITSYMEARIMDHLYGADKSVFEVADFHAGDKELQRHGYYDHPTPKISPVLTKPWEMPKGTYGMLTYQKPATWLHTLENIIGEDVMDELLRTYYNRYGFKHPDTDDFIDVANEVVTRYHDNKYGRNLKWFFTQMLEETSVCDYKISDITFKQDDGGLPVIPTVQQVKKEITENFQETDESDKNRYESRITIYRSGEVTMPQEILVHFDNGEEILETWDGKDRYHILQYERPAKVVWAEIDPKEKILVDKNINNNSYTTESKKLPLWKYTVKFLFWVQNLAQFFSIPA